MPHCCQDEVFAVLAILSGYKYILPYFKNVWASRHNKPGCRHNHGHGKDQHKGEDDGK